MQSLLVWMVTVRDMMAFDVAGGDSTTEEPAAYAWGRRPL